MMLRSLVDEVVRRRLWPIPLVALLIAIAAPVLFMKSAPADAPGATQAPPAAAPGELPKTAEKLVSTSDKAVTPRQTSKPKAQDPFAPPASAAKSDSSSSKATATATDPATAAIPVVIKNSDGSTSTATITKSSSKSKTSKTTKPKTAAKPKVTVPKTTTPVVTPEVKSVAYVDVRFAKRAGSQTRFRIPRLQTFQADRKVAAMFVGYSAKRNAATFAVAPSTQVKGIACRKVKGVCRYVDIPEGRYARLVLRGIDGTLTSRRLEVVSIRQLPPAPASKVSERKTTLTAAKCLLENLLALPVIAPSIRTDACA
jgi:hypothetical protein